MTTYQIMNPVKPRATASMYETNTLDNLTVGYSFDTSATTLLVPNPPIAGQSGAILWLQLPAEYNNYWIPAVYKNVVYAQQSGSSGSTAAPVLTHLIKVWSDGHVEVYDSSGTILQYNG